MWSALSAERTSIVTIWLRIGLAGSYSSEAVVPGNPWKVTLSPGIAPFGGSRISSLSCDEAHMSMAWFTIPLVSTGLSLHSRTTIRFCICTKGRRVHMFKREQQMTVKLMGKTNKHPKSNRTVLLESNSHSVFSLIDFLIKNSQWDDKCLMLKSQCFWPVLCRGVKSWDVLPRTGAAKLGTWDQKS